MTAKELADAISGAVDEYRKGEISEGILIRDVARGIREFRRQEVSLPQSMGAWPTPR